MHKKTTAKWKYFDGQNYSTFYLIQSLSRRPVGVGQGSRSNEIKFKRYTGSTTIENIKVVRIQKPILRWSCLNHAFQEQTTLAANKLYQLLKVISL